MQFTIQETANHISRYLPGIVGALLLLLIGWLVARGVRSLAIRLLKKTSWDEKMFGKTVDNSNAFIGNILYYLIMIVVLLIVLEVLGISQVLGPIELMVGQFLAFIPMLVGGIMIALVGHLLAKFVSNLLKLGGGMLDRIIDKTGFNDTEKVINVIRKVVYLVIFIPFLIQAFNTLGIQAIAEPANQILYGFTLMVGDILIAIAVLLLFVWGGRFLCNFLSDLLKSIGFDQLTAKLGLQYLFNPGQSLSRIAGHIAYFFIVFFGVITAVELLQLEQLSDVLNHMLFVTGQIAFGLLVLIIGNFIATLVYRSAKRANTNNFVANVARWGALALFIAIALRTMGIANEIVELAFGLLLGAVAVAIALSYGLGGREAAGEHFKEIVGKMKEKSNGGNDPEQHLP